jgi:hypothetical protein
MAAAAAVWEELALAASTGGDGGTVFSICVFTAVLCLCLVAGHLLEENKWVNESITALIIVPFLPPSISIRHVNFCDRSSVSLSCLIFLACRGASLGHLSSC